MLWSVICTQDTCENKDVEYFIPNQTEPVMCGGCKDFIVPVETNIPEPEILPYAVNLKEL